MKPVLIALLVLPAAPALAQFCPSGSTQIQGGCGSVGVAGCCSAGDTLEFCQDSAVLCSKKCIGPAGGNVCGWTGSAYDCTDQVGADPSGQHPMMCSELPEPVCTPKCEGAECGADGCGGSCGSCPDGLSCKAGSCEEGDTTCTPDCGGGEAGPAHECGLDGCGGICGVCQQPMTCDVETATCVGGEPPCEPDCGGGSAGPAHECGPDGCGGVCGDCPPELGCLAGQCVDPNADPEDTDSGDEPDSETGDGQTATDGPGTDDAATAQTDGSGTGGGEAGCPDGFQVVDGLCVIDSLVDDGAGGASDPATSGSSCAHGGGPRPFPWLVACLAGLVAALSGTGRESHSS